MDPPKRRFDTLASHLEALASPTRLEILHALRRPRELHEIRVAPTLTREGEREERALSRQAVTRHIDQLVAAGLVHRVPAGAGGRGDEYVINHERLFAMVDDMRGLTRLRPMAEVAPGQTVEMRPDEPAPLPPKPRLALAYGRDDGVAFPLSGDGPWAIGRSAGAKVRLDYDPYLSGEHARIERAGEGFHVEDLKSRNGTLVNWRLLRPLVPAPLLTGDILVVGRCVLVFQA